MFIITVCFSLLLAAHLQHPGYAQTSNDGPCIIGLCENGEPVNGSECLPVAQEDFCSFSFSIECRIRTPNDTGGLNLTTLRCMDTVNLTDGTLQTILYNQEEMFYLYLERNGIESLQPGVFNELSLLYELYLNDNSIEVLKSGTFVGLEFLNDLFLDGNGLKTIEPGSFTGLDTLYYLILANNNLQEIQNDVFSGLASLRQFELQNNQIVTISEHVFNEMENLNALNLSNNKIQTLQNGIFSGLHNLRYLELNDNEIHNIEVGAFENLTNLEFVFLLETRLQVIHPDILNGLSALLVMSASDSRICCLLRDRENVTCAEASPPSPLQTCGSLFPSLFLRIAGWFVALIALIANGIVIFIRVCRHEKRTSKTQHAMIISLAFADCLMGIYMIIITSADVHFGELYYLSAPVWRESVLCKFSGFLSFLSSEASVFSLTLITIDRCICILFPFGQHRISTKVANIIIIFIWFAAIFLSALPLILSSYIPGVYGLSDVCIGLPLHVTSNETGVIVRSTQDGYDGYRGAAALEYVPTKASQRPSWAYSVAIFIGLNCVLFITLFACYIVMFISVRRSARSVINNVSQQKDIQIARKMAFLVGTDFFCWMPVIIMGILSQTGLVPLPASLYAWSVILIIPINSSINPVLYTFIAYLEKKKRSTPSWTNTRESTHEESKHGPRQGTGYSPVSRQRIRVEVKNGGIEMTEN